VGRKEGREGRRRGRNERKEGEEKVAARCNEGREGEREGGKEGQRDRGTEGQREGGREGRSGSCYLLLSSAMPRSLTGNLRALVAPLASCAGGNRAVLDMR
jgi:hypothetical protein